MVSPGARGGLKVDFDLFLRKGLNTIVHSSHGFWYLRRGNTEQQSRLRYLTAVVQLVEIKSPSMPGCLKLLYAQRKTPTQTYRIKTAYNKLLKATQFPSRGVKFGASWNPRQWFKWTPTGTAMSHAVVWAKSFHKFLQCSRSLITHGVLR